MDFTPYKNQENYEKIKNLPEAEGFFDKLDQDPNFSDEEKIKLLNLFMAFNSDGDEDLKEYCESQMIPFKFRGPQYNGDRSHFIRINDVPRFKGWIRLMTGENALLTIDELMSGDSDTKPLAFRALLETYIDDEIPLNPDLKKRYLGLDFDGTAPVLSDAKTAEHMEWSFPLRTNEDNIFEPEHLEVLDCRAGLAATLDQDKVVYVHNINECEKLLAPTILDAGFSPQFEPGGKTKPLDECDAEEGFEEYVHTPNRFKNIQMPYFIKKPL